MSLPRLSGIVTDVYPLLGMSRTSTVLYALRWYITFTVPVPFKSHLSLRYVITYGRTLPRKGYTSVSIPDEMIQEIDRVIAKKKYGYTSRADLVADAIRCLMVELKPLAK